MNFIIKNIECRWVSQCLLVMLFCLFSSVSPGQQYSIADTAKARQLILDAYHGAQTNPKQSLEQATEALQISKTTGYITGIEKATKTVGYAYYTMGDMKNAYQYFTDALDFSRHNHLVADEAKTLFHLGQLYISIGEFDKAFEVHVQALKIEQSLNDSGAVADAYKSIAVDLDHQKLFDEGNSYLLKAIELYHALKDPESEAQCYSYIGTNDADMGKYDESYPYFRKSLQTKKTSEAYGNLGYYFYKINNDDSALYYYNIALNLNEADSDRLDMAKMEENIGTCFIRKGDLAKAEAHLKRALLLVNKVSYIETLGQVEGNLSELYGQEKDYKNAYQYHIAATKIKDSIINATTQAKLAELNTRFEVKEVEDKNKTLQKENDFQKLKIQRKNTLIYGTIGAFIALFIIGLLLIRQNRIRADQQKTELEQKQLRAQMNPHFIFNCLNSIQNFIVANDVKNANKYLSGFASLMRQTLENSKEGTITLRKEITYLENYLTLERMRFEGRFTTEIICADNINKDVVEIPAMIIQPFVENAIRHGLCYLEDKVGWLKILFYTREGYLVCEVDDNGIGREQSQKIKMASEVVYESHGMELTRQRLALVSKTSGTDYKIEITDKKNAQNEPEGTTVIIKFPLTV